MIAVTLIVAEAEAEVSNPPFAVPPLFCTANEKVAYDAPEPLAAGVNTTLPCAISLAATASPAVTASPL